MKLNANWIFTWHLLIGVQLLLLLQTAWWTTTKVHTIQTTCTNVQRTPNVASKQLNRPVAKINLLKTKCKLTYDVIVIKIERTNLYRSDTTFYISRHHATTDLTRFYFGDVSSALPLLSLFWFAVAVETPTVAKGTRLANTTWRVVVVETPTINDTTTSITRDFHHRHQPYLSNRPRPPRRYWVHRISMKEENYWPASRQRHPGTSHLSNNNKKTYSCKTKKHFRSTGFTPFLKHI